MLHCGTIVSDCTLGGGPSVSRSWRGQIADDTISCVDVFRNTIAIGTLSGNILFNELQRVGSSYRAVARSTIGRLDQSAPHAPANVLKYSPCGDYLAMGTIKGDVIVLQVSAGNLGSTLKILYLECVHPQGAVLSLAWSYDSCRLYSGCTLGLVHEHINETPPWSRLSYMLGVSSDRGLFRFEDPIIDLGCTSFTVPNSVNKTDVIIVSVKTGVYFCYSSRNHSASPWKSGLISGACGQSLLFNSTLGHRFEAKLSGSSVRNAPAPCTDLCISLGPSAGVEAGGCGVECSNVAIYDCRTSLKLQNDTIYQSVYSTTASRLAHTNNVKLRDDLDLTAFSQLVPMQADSSLSIFFGVTTGHRLAVIHLKAGCFNVVDLFKYVHKVIVAGSNVYILHSSSASGVMLLDLIRIVFVDVDTNRVTFPLYSYRLHAAIVTLQRCSKRKIKESVSNRRVLPGTVRDVSTSENTLKPSKLRRSEAALNTSLALSNSTPMNQRPLSSISEINDLPELISQDPSENPEDLTNEVSDQQDEDVEDGESFMKETAGTWLEQWRDDIAPACSSRQEVAVIYPGGNMMMAPKHAGNNIDSGNSWLQNAYTSGTYLLSVPYAGTSPPAMNGRKWKQAEPLLQENSAAYATSGTRIGSVKSRICARRSKSGTDLQHTSTHGPLKKRVLFPPDIDVLHSSNDDYDKALSAENIMLQKIPEFLKFKWREKSRSKAKPSYSGEVTTELGGVVDTNELAREDFERRTYTVTLPLYPSCGTGIKFDLLPDGGLIVIDFVSSVKYKGTL